MAGARHAARPTRGLAHRVVNALCSAVVVAGVATMLLAGRADGYADVTEPRSGVLAVGHAVVPDGLYPGAVVNGQLPVSNGNGYDVHVTGVVFGLPVADADHSDCRPGSVVLSAARLPSVPGKAAQSIPFTVTMSPTVGNACQGATFTSGYTVNARAA